MWINLWNLSFIWVTIATVASQNFASDYTLIKRLNDLMQATINTVLITIKPNSSTISKDVTFWCATRTRPSYVQVFVNDSALADKIDLAKPMAFVVHGWFDNVNRTWLKTTVADYTKYVDTNVCAVDWSQLARVEYSLAAATTPDVAGFLAKFIMLLQDQGIGLDRITIVGHSLGAHIAGFVGSTFKGNIAEIIGLDPAGPGGFFKENGRLNATNARFVQVLHTDQGFCGTTMVSGHQDFYPNNGFEPQPGCIVPFLQNGIGLTPTICSHYKAVEYFWASLNPDNKFRALQCANYDEYLSGRCNTSASANFGVHGDRNVRGTFYLSVKANYPFFL